MNLFLPRKLDLPRALDEVEYRVNPGHGDYSNFLIVHIERGKFRGKTMKQLDRYDKRKLENLFMLSLTKEPMKFVYE